MLDIIELCKGVLELGFIYSLVVIAVFLTSKIISFDDLTVEGSFGIGGAVAACCALWGFNPLVAILFSIMSGILAGIATGLLARKLNINGLISGLIVTTALFSVSKKVAGSAMVTIPADANLFNCVGIPTHLNKFIILASVSFGALFFVKWLLRTEFGSMLKALGCNPQLLTNLGKNINGYTIATLSIANGLTACAGALFVNYTSFFSLTGNIGTFIYALAGLMFAEIFSDKLGVAIILGAIAYPALYMITIQLQLDPDLTKLIIALLMVTMLLFKRKSIKHVAMR